jgi:hypothetical protein
VASFLLALADVYGLYLHVLERTGGAARLIALDLPVEPSLRPFLALVLAGSLVLLLYASLASGDETRVRTFRAVTLLGGAILPLAAARTWDGPWRIPLGGGVLVALLLAGLVHRSLSSSRRSGTAERFLLRTRWGIETVGFVLFAVAAGLYLDRGSAPLRVAFWGFFLLRLSVADLADPARLASAVGLSGSAARDLKSAATGGGRRRRPPASRRLVLGTAGLAKLALVLLWIALPLLAALAPAEVAAGSWPGGALLLRLYPSLALALTAGLLLAGALRGARRAPVDAARALVVAAATGLSLWAAWRLPEWETWRRSLSGLYLAETLFAFLLGAAARGR